MKKFTEAQVDDIIRMKWGELVLDNKKVAYVTNAVLAKVFNCTASKIRRLYMARFEKHRRSEMSLMERLQQGQRQQQRRRWGYRFLLAHEIKWLTSAETLKR